MKPYISYNLNTKLRGNQLYSGEMLLVTGKIWDGNLAESSHITSIGNIMYTSYSI
jgi:hypothetical protein